MAEECGTLFDLQPAAGTAADGSGSMALVAAEFGTWLSANMPGGLDERVALINALRRVLHEAGPFAGEPVDFVEWVPAAGVQANDYNPNSVAPPEMELLRLSIMADGFTQPIVANDEDGIRVVVDGFHRNRVGKECADVTERVRSYLPVVQIRADREDRGDRIAVTIRHNRARGKHQVTAMSEIVLELKRRNWSDKKIGKELGMDPDEVLRLAQISGLAEAGLTVHQMRICQPYGDDQRRGLWLFHLIEPQTWSRVVARVNGANGGASARAASAGAVADPAMTCKSDHTEGK